MKDTDIDAILAENPREVDPAVLKCISSSIGKSLQPVRPIAPVWMLASVLFLISAGIAVVSGLSLGMYGFHKLNGTERGALFPALAIFTWLAALLSVAEMTPGGFRWKNPILVRPVMTNPARLLLIIMAAWIAVDAILFQDYQMVSFVPDGIPCLRAGLVVAIPTGFASWLVLRRGFAVNATGSGLAAGTLAGLAGLSMLELHCANLHAMHVMVWHTAVIPLSAVMGALLAKSIVHRASAIGSG
jgi:hypothetical protein